jgi:hypothetical protein
LRKSPEPYSYRTVSYSRDYLLLTDYACTGTILSGGAELFSNNTAVSRSAAAAATDADHADADAVKGARAINHWTPKEEAKLNSAVMNTSKKRCGKEYRIYWVTVAALVPGRVEQCRGRWNDVLDPNIDQPSGSKRKWTEDKHIKLKDAV